MYHLWSTTSRVFYIKYMLVSYSYRTGRMQAAKTKLEEVKFEAYSVFDDSRYRVAISKCQQLALSKAIGPVPLPSEQLALANQKKDKEPSA